MNPEIRKDFEAGFTDGVFLGRQRTRQEVIDFIKNGFVSGLISSEVLKRLGENFEKDFTEE